MTDADKFKYQRWYQVRQWARTDLLFLCNRLLNYKDVTEEVHGPLINSLQKFKGGQDYHDPEYNWVRYEPACPIWDLEGPRNRLILQFRGSLKTTINTVAHSIQWIINYPDIRILASMATGTQVSLVLKEIRDHFRYNENFRTIFPELCPLAKKASDFGNNEEFTVRNRGGRNPKEPTLMTCSVGKVIAGIHVDVVKHSDLVDKENVSTPNQIEDVKSHFRYVNPLIERGTNSKGLSVRGWQDVEGTPYNQSDLYAWIEDNEEKAKEKSWLIFKRPVIEPDGTLNWPNRFDKAEIEKTRIDIGDDYIFYAQYYMVVTQADSALASRDEIKFIDPRIMDALRPRLRIHTTIDLAGMEAERKSTDFTVLTTAGFDRDGRCYILDIRRARFTPFEVIENIFDIHKTYRPIDIKIEKEAHARVILPFLAREMNKRQIFPMMVPIRRDNRASKEQRIRSLQPWFKGGILKFADDISCKMDLIQEILKFPKFNHDDILDTLADQMQNRDGGVICDVMPEEKVPVERLGAINFIGFDPFSHQPMWAGMTTSVSGSYDPYTGL